MQNDIPLCSGQSPLNKVLRWDLFIKYPSVPNRCAGQNKRAGGKILKKAINILDRIEVQGGNFLENQ